MLVCGILLALAAALLLIERIVLSRSLKRLPIRIHVQGTRGKSSVAEYIACAMRADGRQAWAKVTGIRPTIVTSHGVYDPIRRRSAPRVQEQFRIIYRAARAKTEALILECMSIQPQFQALETRFFQPHVIVLTNVRSDHQEVVGEDAEAPLRAFCDALIPGTTIVVSPEADRPILRQAVRDADATLVIVDEAPEDYPSECDGETFGINVALAVKACEVVGLDGQRAREAIHSRVIGRPDRTSPDAPDRPVFVNGFAVNDVPSAKTFIQRNRDRFPEARNLAVIFNARPDRPMRSQRFAGFLSTLPGVERIILIGKHAPYMRRQLRRHGVSRGRVITWNSKQAQKATEALAQLNIGRDWLVIGLGNIVGDGFVVAANLSGEGAYAV